MVTVLSQYGSCKLICFPPLSVTMYRFCTDQGSAGVSGLCSEWVWGWRALGSRQWTGCPLWSAGTGGWTERSGGTGCWSRDGEKKKRRTCVSKNAELTKASFSQTHTQYMKASESRPQSCCRSVLQFNHLKKKKKTKAPAFLKKASRVRAQC